MNPETRKSASVLGVAIVFAALAAWFVSMPLRPVAFASIPLVDTNFLSTATVRQAYPDLVRAGADLSDFDCYTCHEKGKAPTLRYDAEGKLVIPKEHSDIVMGHGSHGRNNNCYNCHNETNLTVLQARDKDKKEVTFSNSQLLCGSCHGPTYRDWETGAHGRTSGYWERSAGPIDRKICVNCHDPHSPHFPGRHPAPGPHPLHPVQTASANSELSH